MFEVPQTPFAVCVIEHFKYSTLHYLKLMFQREAFAEMPQKNQFWFPKEYFTEINLFFLFLSAKNI